MITGQDEAIYDWVTVNFLKGALSGGDTKTYGALDMGGASHQNAFKVSNSDDCHRGDENNGDDNNLSLLLFLCLCGNQLFDKKRKKKQHLMICINTFVLDCRFLLMMTLIRQ